MRKELLYILLLLIAFVSCSKDNKKTETATQTDTIPMMVTQLQKCSRLYTSEYRIHKIITHSDKMRLKGSLLKQDFHINLPMGDRRIAIPMTATLKAYVDMGDISEKNIKRSGKKITITLPDPQFALTSTKVANEETRQYVALTRSNFSDEELADYTRQGRQSIIGSIPKMGIIENARASAARTIIPIIKATGYSEDNITVTFRKSFTSKDLEALFNNKIEQYGKDN